MELPCRKKAPALRLMKFFAPLEDPRVVGRTTHPLVNVLVIALAAMIGGANGWEEFAAFGDDHRAWFAGFLDLSAGIPSPDTFRRVFRVLRPAAFAACVRAWVASLADSLAGQVVAFDGKTLRGALRRAPHGETFHQVHLWACAQGLLLAHTGVAGAPGEIAAVRDLLALVDLDGAIATGDAAHCNAPTAAAILDTGASYALHLKANRRTQFAYVAGFFAAARADGFAGVEVQHDVTLDTAHGRVERREIWVLPHETWEVPGVAWPGLQAIAMIERIRVVDGDISCEQHYYLTSLAPDAPQMAAVAREHWSVENPLHWVLDAQMAEDACAIHAGHAAENVATLRRIALMLLKRETTVTRGIAAKQAKAARNTDYLTRVLTRGINED